MTEYAGRLANSTDTKERVRQFDTITQYPAGPLQGRNGLRRDGGGEVTVVAGTMGVQVSAFSGWVDGGMSDAQGGYLFVCDATKALTLADGDASLARTDTIVAQVQDDVHDASGSTLAQVRVVTGTPGAGAPTLPASCIPLRDVSVPAGLSAGTGGLSSSNLGADRRSYTVAAGGILPVASATERDALTVETGAAVYREDSGDLQVFNGATWDTYQKSSSTPYVHVYSSAVTRAPGARSAVAWSTVDEAAGGVTVAGSVITFGNAGLYTMQGAADYENASGYCQIFLVDVATGADLIRGIDQRTTAYVGLNLAKTIRVDAGQQVRVELAAAGSNTGTANFAGGADRLFFTAVKVGE